MTVGDDSAPFFPEIPSPLAGEGEDEGVNINEVGFILGDAVGKLVANHIESNDEAGKELALTAAEYPMHSLSQKGVVVVLARGEWTLFISPPKLCDCKT
jgi:hypothetical protein